MDSNGPAQQIDLNELSMQQLQQLRQSHTDEVQTLTSNMTNLRTAVSRFNTSIESLATFTPENDQNTIFIPLTSSMYIPGKLSNVTSVLVDIGTGYYVDKPIADAKSYIANKVTMLGGNIDAIAGIALSKRKDLDTITIVLQGKMTAMRNQQMQQVSSIEQETAGI